MRVKPAVLCRHEGFPDMVRDIFIGNEKSPLPIKFRQFSTGAGMYYNRLIEAGFNVRHGPKSDNEDRQ
jgi:hypothetical protein